LAVTGRTQTNAGYADALYDFRWRGDFIWPCEYCVLSEKQEITISEVTQSMSTNPYHPPESRIVDRMELARPPRPKQINIAVALLWVTFMLSLYTDYLDKQHDSYTGSVPVAFVICWQLFVYALSATINVCVFRGQNWARFATLFFFLLGGAAMLYFAEEFSKLSQIELTIAIVSNVLELIALYFLFTKPGAAWFKPAE
jgi:hypothetical protein